MNINREQLEGLLKLVGITADEEINCEEFLALLPGYLERLREQMPRDGENSSLLHHLQICPECQEEVEGLIAALDEGVL